MRSIVSFLSYKLHSLTLVLVAGLQGTSEYKVHSPLPNLLLKNKKLTDRCFQGANFDLSEHGRHYHLPDMTSASNISDIVTGRILPTQFSSTIKKKKKNVEIEVAAIF